MSQPNEPFDGDSQFPPALPSDPLGQGPFYQDPRPYGSAPTLVKVAAIMNIVVGGLDIIWSGLLALFLIMYLTNSMPKELSGPDSPFAGVPPAMVEAEFGAFTVLALSAGIFQLVGGIKVLRKSRHAWGLGLACGIVGCLQIWCSLFCVLPMGIGIFTIVVMALGNTRAYLRAAAGSTSGAA